jgi:peptidoglycan hydrolase-like protein with peptidoglycan-binding domain
MQIANTFASKALVAVVAAAMVFSAFATPAKAATDVEMLQAQINALLAQLNALQGQGGTSTSVASGVCPFTWTRDLKTGATGADVMKLQQFLNANADTRVAASGAGSVGAETQTFGPATAAAVSKFQVMHRADILTPAGLTTPTGFFGPSTRAKANALCVAAPTTPTGTTTTPDTDDEDTELEGEGTLNDGETDLDEASDDTVMEGESEAEIGTLTLGAQNGDIEVSRLSFVMVDDTTGTANEADLWETFEAITLMVDGEEIGSFDASDEDNYLDEDDGTFNISSLDLVISEDEEVEIEIVADIMSAVDGSDTTNAADWSIDVTDVRYFDADGVASDDDIDSETDESVVSIVEEGLDDEATIESSSDTRAEGTLKVDEDSSDSEEFEIFTFDIEVDEESSDLTFNDEAYLDVTFTNPASASTTPTPEEVIESITLTIDGEEVEGDTDDADHELAIATSSNRVVTYSFDFDGMTLDADATYAAVVTVVFKGQDEQYSNNLTIDVDVDGADWEVEGLAGDFNVLTGTESSETMTLATVVPVITEVDSSISQPNDVSNSGSIIFEFNLKAEDDDVTITRAALDAAVALSSSAVSALAKPTPSFTKSSGDATAGVNEFTVEEGDDATFKLTYTFTTSTTTNNGIYSMTLDTIAGVEVEEVSPDLSLSN